jgi:hypothetical protein
VLVVVAAASTGAVAAIAAVPGARLAVVVATPGTAPGAKADDVAAVGITAGAGSGVIFAAKRTAEPGADAAVALGTV